jgi:hypothetical protein
VSAIKVLPSAAVILMSGSTVLKMALTIVSRPLNTERIIIRAIVPTATPATDTEEIMFIAFRDFFANRYLFAIYNESFTSYFLAVTSNPVPVLWVKLRSIKLNMIETGKNIK